MDHSRLSAISGGVMAGLAVDLTLFPIDTIKTRLQSGLGFHVAGGFKSLYAGAPSVMIGSAPGSALFFCTYEALKRVFKSSSNSESGIYSNSVLNHSVAAACGESVACLVRVPTEIVKQRAQSFPNTKPGTIFKNIIVREGFSGIYRGFTATLVREIPFSIIEFPLWEYLKEKWSLRRGKEVSPLQSALCGSFAGAIAAAITTPLDVIKTRIMLSQKLYSERPTYKSIFLDIYRVRGARGLYAGVVPRTCWMALGGLVFFGAYETVKFLHISLFQNELSRGSFDRSKFFKFDYILADFIYKSIFEPFVDKENRLRTFDDTIREAQQVAERRKQFIEEKKREKLKSEEAETLN